MQVAKSSIPPVILPDTGHRVALSGAPEKTQYSRTPLAMMEWISL